MLNVPVRVQHHQLLTGLVGKAGGKSQVENSAAVLSCATIAFTLVVSTCIYTKVLLQSQKPKQEQKLTNSTKQKWWNIVEKNRNPVEFSINQPHKTNAKEKYCKYKNT